MCNENRGKLIKSSIKGYAVNSIIKLCFEEEGFVALRLVQNAHLVKNCEAVLVFPDDVLPEGLDTVIPFSMVRCYGDLIALENDSSQVQNIFK